jgi:indolepyruvate ferredoxin oxidoreductase beta subunit
VDYLIGFEWLETLRRISYVRPDGFVLANDCRIDPMTVTSGQADYPAKERIMADLNHAARHVSTIAGTQAALDLGNVLCFNIVVLGGLSKILGNEPGIWQAVIKDRVPPKVAALNLAAYEKGRELIS